MTIYRQGDILLVRCDDRPAVNVIDGTANGIVREPENGRLIIARGEATGHHHSVAVAGAEIVQDAEAVYLRIMAPTTLDHQEHGSIALDPGTYRVIRQREYQPGELPRQVAD